MPVPGYLLQPFNPNCERFGPEPKHTQLEPCLLHAPGQLGLPCLQVPVSMLRSTYVYYM